MPAFRALSSVAILAAACAATSGAHQAAPPDRVEWLTAKPFQQALAAPIAATWENVDLRTITRRIAATRGTAILLDRRIDPSRQVESSASNQSLLEFLQELAREAGGQASVIGNVVYIGPEESAGKLRTLVALRQRELQSEEFAIPPSRRSGLAAAETFQWNDLESPADLIRQEAESRKLSIEGLEQIPHDLWAGNLLPQASAAETLSLLLIQWNLTFEWIPQGRGIKLIPVPERVAIARTHLPPKGTKPARALEQWQQEFPGMTGRVSGGEVLVEATLEQHEAIENLKRPHTPASPVRPKPLKQERFSLRIKDAPASSLMKKLGEPAYGQLTFEYDDDALKEAGIDLNRRITFEVKNATIEQLLKAALEPLGVAVELDNRTVHLKPAEK